MVTPEELEKKLKTTNQLDSVYLLYGEESYLLENALKKIRTTFGEVVKGINDITIDDTNVGELIADIETPAFGFEKKLIIVRNTELFKREVKKKGAKFVEIREKIVDYVKEHADTIQEMVVLVFVEQSVDKGKLLSALESIGATICNFERQKPNQIIARLKAICKAYQVNAKEDTLRYLLECVGSNLQDLINEIRKQIEYVGENGSVTKETIDKLTIKQMESVIFDLTDNLGKKQIAASLEVLNNLLYAKEPIQKILITLYNHFKKIYIVKLAEKYNRNLAEVLNLKPNQMFLMTKYKTQANYFKEEEIRRILEELIDLDRKSKIGLVDINVGLETILCGYCS